MTMRVLAAVLAQVVASSASVALPQNSSDRAKAMETSEALARMAAAYRGGACVDRVSLVATPYPELEGPLPARAIRRAVALVRTFRPANQASLVRLDLGDLCITAVPGSVTATRRGDREHAARFEIDGEPTPAKLAAHLPMLTFPQLWLSLGGDPAQPVTSLTGVVTWESAESTASGPRRLLVLRGRSATHAVVLSAHAATGRLASFEITPIGNAGAKIRARCTALSPGDPSAWGIRTEHRTLVGTLGELRATPGLVEPGATLNEPRLRSADSRPWSLAESLRARAGARPAVGAMIVFTRDTPATLIDAALAGVVRAEVALDLEAGAPTPMEAGSGLTPPPSLLTIGVAGLAPAEADASTLGRIGEAWRSGARGVLSRVLPQATAEPVPLVWADEGAGLLQKLAPGASCAIVVVGSDLRLLGVIEPQGLPGEDQGIADQLRAIAAELRWPE